MNKHRGIEKMIQVAVINWWSPQRNIDDNYILSYIHENITKVTIVETHNNPDLLLCSVFGPIEDVINCQAKKKILFVGENVGHARYAAYNNDAILTSVFDLIIGFKPTNLSKKTIRFPLWILYYGTNANSIINKIEQNYMKNSSKPNLFLGSLVARHDAGGQRKMIYNALSKYGSVACPGALFHNSVFKPSGEFNSVQSKIDFISNGTFNICPENSKGVGYCTEKIFQALDGGCVPLYWGVDLPEKDILNEDKYCFCVMDNSEKLCEIIKNAVENKDRFLSGRVFKGGAKKVIDGYFIDFKEQLTLLIHDAGK